VCTPNAAAQNEPLSSPSPPRSLPRALCAPLRLPLAALVALLGARPPPLLGLWPLFFPWLLRRLLPGLHFRRVHAGVPDQPALHGGPHHRPVQPLRQPVHGEPLEGAGECGLVRDVRRTLPAAQRPHGPARLEEVDQRPRGRQVPDALAKNASARGLRRCGFRPLPAHMCPLARLSTGASSAALTNSDSFSDRGARLSSTWGIKCCCILFQRLKSGCMSRLPMACAKEWCALRPFCSLGPRDYSSGGFARSSIACWYEAADVERKSVYWPALIFTPIGQVRGDAQTRMRAAPRAMFMPNDDAARAFAA